RPDRRYSTCPCSPVRQPRRRARRPPAGAAATSSLLVRPSSVPPLPPATKLADGDRSAARGRRIADRLGGEPDVGKHLGDVGIPRAMRTPGPAARVLRRRRFLRPWPAFCTTLGQRRRSEPWLKSPSRTSNQPRCQRAILLSRITS